jgi:hypothetical protein
MFGIIPVQELIKFDENELTVIVSAKPRICLVKQLAQLLVYMQHKEIGLLHLLSAQLARSTEGKLGVVLGVVLVRPGAFLGQAVESGGIKLAA